jgi:hypothetical protein
LRAEAAPKPDRTRKSAAEENQAAIVLPAKGKIDPDQGTVEAVFKLAYSVGDQMGSGSSKRLFSLLRVCDREGNRGSRSGDGGVDFDLCLSQYTGNDHILLSFSKIEVITQYGKAVRYTAAALPKSLKADTWHTLAVTWAQSNTSHYAFAFYLDGVCIRRHSMPIRELTRNAGVRHDDLLMIGYPGQMYGSLESLRISKRVRDAAEIAAADKAGLTADAETLLLLDAAAIGSLKGVRNSDALKPEKGKALRVPAGGAVFGTLRSVPGRTGKAVQFRSVLP